MAWKQGSLTSSFTLLVGVLLGHRCLTFHASLAVFVLLEPGRILGRVESRHVRFKIVARGYALPYLRASGPFALPEYFRAQRLTALIFEHI